MTYIHKIEILKQHHPNLLELDFVKKRLENIKSEQYQYNLLFHLVNFQKFVDKPLKDLIVEYKYNNNELFLEHLFSYFAFLIGDKKSNKLNSKEREKTVSKNLAKQYCGMISKFFGIRRLEMEERNRKDNGEIFADLLKIKKVRDWIAPLKTESTKSHVLHTLRKLSNFTDSSVEDLISESKENKEAFKSKIVSYSSYLIGDIEGNTLNTEKKDNPVKESVAIQYIRTLNNFFNKTRVSNFDNKATTLEEDWAHLLQFKAVTRWLENVAKKKFRLSTLSRFCSFTEKTPEQLINEHHEDLMKPPISNGDYNDGRQDICRKQLLSFFAFLIGENDYYKNNINDKKLPKEDTITTDSAKQYVFGILASFFKRNFVPVVFVRGDRPPENRQEQKEKTWRKGTDRIEDKHKIYTLKQIRDTFKNVRDRTVFICKLSSGLDDIDLFNLKIQDFYRGRFPSDKICYVEGYRKKSKIFYQTFFNSEAYNLIELYLIEREKKGIPTNESDWLFLRNKLDEEGKHLKLEPKNYYKNQKEVCNILNLNNITPKSLRRWFSTTLKLNGIVHEIVERMMGHQVKIPQKYVDIIENQEAFKDFYIENIEQYTLLGESSQKVRVLDNKVAKLSTTTTNLAVENQDLKKQIIKSTSDKDKAIETLTEKLNSLANTVSQLQTMIVKGDLNLEAKLPDIFAENQENEEELARERYHP